MATHSSILAWEIPWTEEPGKLQSIRSQESDMTLQLNDNKNSEYRKHSWGFITDKQSEEVSSKWRGSKRRHYGEGDSC